MDEYLFRKLAHLEEQIGRRRFLALIDPNNTKRVRDFSSELVTLLPAQMIVGNRTYEIVGFEGDELNVAGRVIVEQAHTKDIHLGEEDGRYILDEDRQKGIPTTLREVSLVCADWRASHSRIACLIWLGDHWGVSFGHVNRIWCGPLRLLRRKAA